MLPDEDYEGEDHEIADYESYYSYSSSSSSGPPVNFDPQEKNILKYSKRKKLRFLG
jgi:hypothetical protein